jgi:hypothetical protein
MTAAEHLTSAEADDVLLKRVRCFLHQRRHRLQQSLKLSIEQGIVVVQGRMPTFYLRQVALECVKRVAGVTQIVDLIEVVDDSGLHWQDDTCENDQGSCVEPTRQSTNMA